MRRQPQEKLTPLRSGYGVGVTVDELIALRADARRLAPATPDTASAFFPGLYRALLRGRGLEFEEARPYQSGDDYRNIDWRVTARTGKLHTKIFREEREHSVYIVIDAGRSMHFGTKKVFKWVAACRCAAIISWLAVEGRDRVGGLIFGSGPNCLEYRPLSGERGALRLFKGFEGVSFGGTVSGEKNRAGPGCATLSNALLYLRRIVHPGSLILIFSDFTKMGEGVHSRLSYLSAHNDVTVFFFYDPLEADLPPAGDYIYTDGEAILRIDSSNNSLRKNYQDRFEKRRNAASYLCKRRLIRFWAVSTDDDPARRLKRILT